MRRILIFCFVFFSWNAYSQDSLSEVELTHYFINNQKFERVLETYLDSEKVHSYYTDSMPLWISIWHMPDHNKKIKFKVFDISSVLDTNEVLDIHNYGYVYYKSHLVCLWGDTLPEIFSKTTEKRKFIYIDNMKLHPPIPAMNDGDPGSQWHYKYFQNEFTIMNKKRGIK